MRTAAAAAPLVVRTRDAGPRIDIDERELFALLPRASIRLGADQRPELVLPR